MMFDAPALYQKEIEQIKTVGFVELEIAAIVMKMEKYTAASPQNARVGRVYPGVMVSMPLMHPDGLRYHWRETPNGPEVRDCKEDEVCEPVGSGFLGYVVCGDCKKMID